MNSTTATKLILGLGLPADSFFVKGERSGKTRSFLVTIRVADQEGRAADIKAALVAEGEKRGLGVLVDVVPQVNPLGKVLA